MGAQKNRLTEPYVVGAQKNRLTETILLSTHNIGFKGQIRISEHAKRPLSRALHIDHLQHKKYIVLSEREG